jgi:ribosomal protein S18 acetylase RimI-like enzyme
VRSVVPGYVLDDDPARVDVAAAWAFLSTEAYWGRWRTRDVLAAQVASAWRLVGVYPLDSGAMVGFGRAFSDGAATAYLADVYVLPEHRGRGLASALLRLMIDDGPGADFRWMLHTSDAHGLYAKAGFGRPDASYLERPAPASRASLPPGAQGAQGAQGES